GAEAKRADADARRYKVLCVQGVVSRQQSDQATATTQTANAQLASARAQVDVARSSAATSDAEVIQAEGQMLLAQAQVGQARARLVGASAGLRQVKVSQEQANSASGAVEQARANVELALNQVYYTKICAPVSGHIKLGKVGVGEIVDAGQELAAIVQGQLYV